MTTKHDKAKKAAKEAAKSAKSLVIERPNIYRICLEIEQLMPMIHNCFSQKTLEQMLRKHMGLPVDRTPKKPIELIEQAIVYNEKGKVCIPPTAIKKAMLTASVLDKSFPKTQLRQLLFVVGGSIPITYDKKVNRMDMVRVGKGLPDIRFRPQFEGWKARLIIEYSEKVDVQYVVDLLNRAGSVGVMEWRPEKDGCHGTFKVSRVIDKPKELAEVYEECMSPLKKLEIPDWALQAEITPELLKDLAHENTKGSFKESETMTDEEVAEYQKEEKAKAAKAEASAEG